MEEIKMRRNRDIIVEKNNGLIKNVIENFSLKAFAEEDPTDDNDAEGGVKSNTLNYEDLIAKARKEEKEKQYKTIEKLKGQVDTFTKQHNDDLLVVAELKDKLAKAEASASKGDDTEINSLKGELEKLQNSVASLTEENEKLKSQTPIDRSEIEAQIRAELETEYEVKTYKAEKMAELKEDILVPELVFGNTKEEIDASIQSALNRSEEIRKSLGITEKKEKRTPKSPSNPSVSGIQNKEISMEYLASLDVSSKEYAEVRKQLGLK